MKNLEIGGGENPRYHPNIDIRKLPQVDIVVDLEKPLPMESDAYDNIYSQYALEHISWRNIEQLIHEIYRICAPGGQVEILIPNTLEQCKEVAKRNVWTSNESCMLFGDQNYGENSHKTGFSSGSVRAMFEQVGFSDIQIVAHPQTNTDMILRAKKISSLPVMNLPVSAPKATEIFEREYFEDGTYGYTMYRDFPVHYKTASMIESYHPTSVLDIGGARGYIVKILNTRGIPGGVMDISKHCYYTRAIQEFYLHDMTQTPWPIEDNHYDMCFSIATLEHIAEKDLPTVIKEQARTCKRALHGITFKQTPNDHDTTHQTLHDKTWWENKFHEIVPNFPVIIMDKEMLEAPPYEIPVYDGLVKLNLGSYTSMFHYGWTNTDIVDLAGFAQQNAYTFEKQDLTQPFRWYANSVNMIIMSHVIEHFDLDMTKKILTECFRVLKPGGIIRLTTPDNEKINTVYKNTPEKFDDFRHFNVGVARAKTREEALNALIWTGHKSSYTKTNLLEILQATGFADITFPGFGESRNPKIRVETVDMYPEISLYAEATKPTVLVTTPAALSSKARSKEKLNIALVSTPFLDTPPKAYGGLERIVADLARGISRLGHDVTVFATDDSYVEGCKMVKCGPAKNTTKVDWHEAEKQMYEVYKDQLRGFDIVHGHNWFGYEYKFKALNPQAKVLHTHHGGLEPNWWCRYRAPFPLNFVGISGWMQRMYESQGMRSRYVYNGVDLSRYPLNEEPRGNRLLFVGRLDTMKRPDIALGIARMLNMPMDIVGGSFVSNDAYMDTVKKQCGRVIDKYPCDIRENTCTTLYLDAPHDVKVRLIQRAACTLFTSCMGEPFGLVPIESMACGTPVAAINDGAVDEVVRQGGVIGRIFDKRPNGGHAQYTIIPGINGDEVMKISVLSAMKINPKQCRSNAETFDISNMVQGYLDLYYSILGGNEW